MPMQVKEQGIKRMLFWLLAVSAIVRGILAAWLEFGNDEVYYWTYALYPDWSHFDHPPTLILYIASEKTSRTSEPGFTPHCFTRLQSTPSSSPASSSCPTPR